MLNQTITIPEQDYSLFLEVVKRFRWKIANEQNNLTPNIEVFKQWNDVIVQNINPSPDIITTQLKKQYQKDLEEYKENPNTALEFDEFINEINS